MRKFNRIVMLDQCIDGNSDNMSELLGPAYDQFNVFYAICKEYIGSNNITAVSYKGVSDGHATFFVSCPKTFERPDFSKIVCIDSPKLVSHQTKTDDGAHGLSFNIFVKE